MDIPKTHVNRARAFAAGYVRTEITSRGAVVAWNACDEVLVPSSQDVLSNRGESDLLADFGPQTVLP